MAGAAALAAAARGAGRAALIMHMSYIDYQGDKHDSGPDADAKHRRQATLFQDPQACVFAVGPLLRDACEELAGRQPIMLVPGFPDRPAGTPPDKSLVAITFGRMDRTSDRIKQGRLAVAGFGRALKTKAGYPFPMRRLDAPRLYLIGIGADCAAEAAEAQAFVDTMAERAVNLIALPYDEDRQALMQRLAGANLSLMLSWHEGFGLTGWEAIASGVPLIVGTHSGLYRLIDEELGCTWADTARAFLGGLGVDPAPRAAAGPADPARPLPGDAPWP